MSCRVLRSAHARADASSRGGHSQHRGALVPTWSRIGLTKLSALAQVGKTLLTTALLRSSAAAFARKYPSPPASPGSGAGPSARKKRRVFYLKPVSTGPPEEADDA